MIMDIFGIDSGFANFNYYMTYYCLYFLIKKILFILSLLYA